MTTTPNGSARRAPGADHKAKNQHRENTPAGRDTQPSPGAIGMAHYARLCRPSAPRWQVCTTKTSGASVKFGEYPTKAEALAVATRLREVGGNATVVEVLP